MQYAIEYGMVWYGMQWMCIKYQTVPSQFIIEILQLQNSKEWLCNTHNYLKVYLKYTHTFEWIVCIYVCLGVCVCAFQYSLETSNFHDKNALNLLRIWFKLLCQMHWICVFVFDSTVDLPVLCLFCLFVSLIHSCSRSCALVLHFIPSYFYIHEINIAHTIIRTSIFLYLYLYISI